MIQEAFTKIAESLRQFVIIDGRCPFSFFTDNWYKHREHSGEC